MLADYGSACTDAERRYRVKYADPLPHRWYIAPRPRTSCDEMELGDSPTTSLVTATCAREETGREPRRDRRYLIYGTYTVGVDPEPTRWTPRRRGKGRRGA